MIYESRKQKINTNNTTMETKIADCIFCNVMEKLFLYETKHSVVLINLFQVEGVEAIAIVPKRHVETVLELPEEEYIDLFLTTRNVHKKLAENGWFELNYILNEGTKISGKTVAHAHMLIFTRKENDGITSMYRPTAKSVTDEHLTTLRKLFV